MPCPDRCATSGRYRDRPGVFTTTSHRSKAARPPSGRLAAASDGLGPRAEKRRNLGGQSGVVQRPPRHGEDPPQRFSRQEGREDQVDETALVALAAPEGESPRPFGIKGLVTAAEGVVVPGERRELAPHPELGPVPEPGEVLRQPLIRQHAAEGGLELLALGELVVDRAATE